MPVRSSGLLVFRSSDQGVEVLLVHPGGPFWARKDEGAWSIPKGEDDNDADSLQTALREFREEIGREPPAGEARYLGDIRQPSGKRVVIWALAGDVDVTDSTSNTFELEWPKGSGQVKEFPEVDRVEWMTIEQARTKLLKGQRPFLELLLASLAEGVDPVDS